MSDDVKDLDEKCQKCQKICGDLNDGSLPLTKEAKRNKSFSICNLYHLFYYFICCYSFLLSSLQRLCQYSAGKGA